MMGNYCGVKYMHSKLLEDGAPATRKKPIATANEPVQHATITTHVCDTETNIIASRILVTTQKMPRLIYIAMIHWHKPLGAREFWNLPCWYPGNRSRELLS